MGVFNARQYHTDQLHYFWTTLTFEDTTVSLGWVPEQAVIVGGAALVDTAFDAGTNNFVDVGFRNAGDGTADDVDEYATDLDVSSTGEKTVELGSATQFQHPGGAEIVASYEQTGSAASAGSAVVYVTFLVDNVEA